MTHAVARRQTLADLLRRSARRDPAKTAIVCGSTRWTYTEFDAICNRVSAGLQAQGIAHGDRVAVLSRNSHAFAALRFALARLGAVLVPINFMLKAEEVAYICGTRAPVCWPPIRASPCSRAKPRRWTPRCAASSGCPRRRPASLQAAC